MIFLTQVNIPTLPTGRSSLRYFSSWLISLKRGRTISKYVKTWSCSILFLQIYFGIAQFTCRISSSSSSTQQCQHPGRDQWWGHGNHPVITASFWTTCHRGAKLDIDTGLYRLLKFDFTIYCLWMFMLITLVYIKTTLNYINYFMVAMSSSCLWFLCGLLKIVLNRISFFKFIK